MTLERRTQERRKRTPGRRTMEEEEEEGDGEVDSGGARQEKPPDEATAANPDESQPALSEVKRCHVFYSNDHIELFFSRALRGTWTA